MAEEVSGRRRIRFGVFELEATTGELRKAGRRVAIGGQPLKILEILATRSGEVVTREELQKELWSADTFVDFEHNLNAAVKRLRAALGDSAESPRFIETLPRRGYRFLVPVEVVTAGASPVASPTPAVAIASPSTSAPTAPVETVVAVSPPRVRSRWIAPAVAVVALVAAATWLLGWTSPALSRREAVRTLAVLPFEHLGPVPTENYLADGTTEALIAELAQLRSIDVISRTSVMRFRDSDLPVPEIARRLDVGAVVQGSVAIAGERVRISVQLTDAVADTHLWSGSFEGSIGELLSLQGRVAAAVAREVRATMSAPEAERLVHTQSLDPAAQEAYFKARFFWNQRTPDGMKRAVEHYEHALSIDRDQAAVWSGLSETWNLLPRYGDQPTRVALLRAKEYALRAIELDPLLAPAHASLAKVQHSLDWNWEASEASFRRALDLSPGYATAHQWYSVFLLTLGRVDEGVFHARRAQHLDPLSPVINLHLGYSLYYRDDIDEARGSLARALELEPGYANAHYLLGWTHLRRGETAAARAAFGKALELSRGAREYLAGVAAAAVAAGDVAAARDVLRQLEATLTDHEGSAQPLFWTLVALGETDRVFEVLERDFANRSVCFYLFDLKNHWFLAPLRADPRLQALFKQAGLPAPTS